MVVRELLATFGIALDAASVKKADKVMADLRDGAAAAGAALGVFMVGKQLLGVVDQFTQLADGIAKTSARLGIASGALQELRYAADLAGVSTQEFDTSMQFFLRTAGDAAAGGATASKAFASLGVSLRDQQGAMKTTDQLFMDVADAMAQLPSDAARAAAAVDVFGRGGARMINLVKSGSKDLAAMRAELSELGGVIDTETLKASEEWQDTLTRLRMVIQGVRYAFVKGVLPGLQAFTNLIIRASKSLQPFIQQSNIMRVAVIGLTMVLGALAVVAGVVLLGKVALLANALFTAATGFAAAGNAALLMQLKAAALGVALLLLSALIIMIAEDIYTFFTGGTSLVGKLADALNRLVSEWIEAPIDPNAHWFMKALHFALGALYKLEGVVADVVGSILGDFGRIESVFDLWKVAWNIPVRIWRETIGSFLDWLSTKLAGVPVLGKLTELASRFGNAAARAATFQVGGAAAPAPGLLPAAAGGSVVNANRLQTSIQITQQPGQDAQALAQAVGDEVDRRLMTMVSDAGAATALDAGVE